MQRLLSIWFRIRIYQFIRLLQSIGWGLLIVFLFVISGLLLSLFDKLRDSASWQVALLISIVPLMLHLQRKDSRFLKMVHLSRRWVYFYEYAVLSFLLALPFGIYLRDWYLVPYAVAGGILISRLPSLRNYHRSSSIWNLPFLPPLAFEWSMGWRQSGVFIVLLVIAGTALAFLTAIPIVCLILIALIVTAFFDPIEPKEWIEPFWRNDFFFLRKWWFNWLIFVVATLPVSIAFLWFQWQYWHILVVVLAVVGMLLFFSVIYKYAAYWPGRRRSHNQIPVGLFLLGFVSLFFLPVSLFFLYRYYRKAVAQLQHYFPKNRRS